MAAQLAEAGLRGLEQEPHVPPASIPLPPLPLHPPHPAVLQGPIWEPG